MRAVLCYGPTAARPTDPRTGQLPTGWVPIATATVLGVSYTILMAAPGHPAPVPTGYTLALDGRAVSWTWSQAIAWAQTKGITLDLVPTVWAGDVDAATDADNGVVLQAYLTRHPPAPLP